MATVGVPQYAFEKVQLCPAAWLCWIMRGGKPRGLRGGSKLECGVGSPAVTWEQPRLPLMEGCCVATGQIILERRDALGVGFGGLLKCESLYLRLPLPHLSAPTRPLRPDVSRGGYLPSQPVTRCLCAGQVCAEGAGGARRLHSCQPLCSGGYLKTAHTLTLVEYS